MILTVSRGYSEKHPSAPLQESNLRPSITSSDAQELRYGRGVGTKQSWTD